MSERNPLAGRCGSSVGDHESTGASRVGRICPSARSVSTPEPIRRMFGWNRCNAACSSETGRRSLSEMSTNFSLTIWTPDCAGLLSGFVVAIEKFPPSPVAAERQSSCQAQPYQEEPKIVHGAWLRPVEFIAAYRTTGIGVLML